MDQVDSAGDAEFQRVMTTSARRIVDGAAQPYDVGMQLMNDLAPLLTKAYWAGAAYSMWGFLTDGIDGPPRYARGLSDSQVEDLMRQAATEWLDLDPNPDGLRHYFERWHDWPDSLGT